MGAYILPTLKITLKMEQVRTKENIFPFIRNYVSLQEELKTLTTNVLYCFLIQHILIHSELFLNKHIHATNSRKLRKNTSAVRSSSKSNGETINHTTAIKKLLIFPLFFLLKHKTEWQHCTTVHCRQLNRYSSPQKTPRNNLQFQVFGTPKYVTSTEHLKM